MKNIIIKDLKEIHEIKKENIHQIIVDVGQNIVELPSGFNYRIISGTCIVKDAKEIILENTARLISLGNKAISATGNSSVYMYNGSKGTFKDFSTGYLSEKSKGYFHDKSEAFINNATGVFSGKSICNKAIASTLTFKERSSAKTIIESNIYCKNFSTVESIDDSSISVSGDYCKIKVGNNNTLVFVEGHKYISDINNLDDFYVHIAGQGNKYFKHKGSNINIKIDSANNTEDPTISSYLFLNEAVSRV